MASEKMSFENVDGRRTDGSGELKIKYPLYPQCTSKMFFSDKCKYIGEEH